MNGAKHPILALLLLLSPLSTGAQEEPPADGAGNDKPATTQEQPPVLNSLKARLEALKQQPLEGEKLEQDVAGEPVFALFKAQTRGEGRGAVLLLHDTASHPDAAGVVHPLRTGLPDAGWSSLSLSLPLL